MDFLSVYLMKSLKNLYLIFKQWATAVGGTMHVNHIHQGERGKTAQVMMQRQEKYTVSPTHVHIAVCGEFDSGKSTLISVLITGTLDNGHGIARNQIVRHNHELETGRTSSISHHSICFSDTGEVLNKGRRFRSMSDLEIAEQTHKLIVFADLAGHQKYFKTALQGFLGREPDVCLVTISAKRGIQIMTREHLGVAVALKVPLLIVVTKTDTCSAINTNLEVTSLLTAAGRTPITMDNSQSLTADMYGALAVPIFHVSSVTGEGLDMLKSYLFKLTSNQKQWDELRLQSVEIRVLEQYKVENDDEDADDDECSLECSVDRKKRSRSFGAGNSAVIVLGMVKTGGASVGDMLLYGPDKLGAFFSVRIASIQINRVPVKTASAGQCATFLIRRNTRDKSFAEPDDDIFVFAECQPPSKSISSSSINGTELSSEASYHIVSNRGFSTSFHTSEDRVIEDDEWTVEDDHELTEIWEKRVGMVLVSPLSNPSACWVFTAELLIINHPSVIRANYEPVVHAENVMQSARLMRINAVSVSSGRAGSGIKKVDDDTIIDALSVGDRGLCRFRFLYQPEYMVVGAAIVIREGRTRGVGRILALHSA